MSELWPGEARWSSKAGADCVEEETPCGQLAGAEDVAPATVSHHLKIPVEAR